MPECKEEDVVVVTTTVASMGDARRLAQSVVDARLAACAQVEPIAASFYVWQGKLCDEPEVRLTFKTTGAQLGRLQEFFAQHHPYDLPQFVAMPCTAGAQYAQWVRSAVSG